MNKIIKEKIKWLKEFFAYDDEEKSFLAYLSGSVVVMLLFLFLVGCARPGHEKGDTYKIMLGVKCADNGTVQSPIWFHTTLGPKQVSKDNCEK